MTNTMHDPPGRSLGSMPLLSDYQPEEPFTNSQLAVLHVPRHATYTLMRERLGGVEPLELIRAMKRGGYRYKCKRGYPGVLAIRWGSPQPERMSFRQIAPVLSTMSGVQVTYETVRRWWEAVLPGEDDEPVDEVDEVEPLPPVAPQATPPKRRTIRRRTPAAVPTVGDGHAEAIRAATERAKSTNPSIPSAVFLPPND